MIRSLFLSTALNAILLLALPAQAAIVSINDQQFDDRGSTTLDLRTQLEWFDVSVTKDRSFNNVSIDLVQEGGLFAPGDGWRYASAAELADLFAAVFAPGYTQGYLELVEQNEAVFNFINLFGDSWTDLSSNSLLITRDLDKIFSAGLSSGIFVSAALHDKVGGFAEVNDNEFIIYSDPTLPGDRIDLPDYLQIAYVYDSEDGSYEAYHTPQLGSWLVRKTVAVPEPATPVVILLGLMVLLLRYRYNSRQ